MKSQPDWIIHVDKQEFKVSQREFELIKNASMAGKTMIWLDELMISIPHISHMVKVKQPRYQEVPRLPEPNVTDMHNKIAGIKAKLRI